MNKRVGRISVNQTAWTLAWLNFFIGIIYAIVAIIVGLVHRLGLSVLLFLFVPFVSAIASYVVYIISCWLYNIAARITGGVEFDLTDAPRRKTEE